MLTKQYNMNRNPSNDWFPLSSGTEVSSFGKFMLLTEF